MGGIIFVLFTVAAIINGISIYRSSSENYMNMLYAQSEQYLNETRDHLSEFRALPWLVEYWRSNRDKMHMTGDAEERKAFLNQMLVEHKISDLRDATCEHYPLFMAGDEEHTKEEEYALGQDWPFHKELHPAIIEMHEVREKSLCLQAFL